MSLFQVKVEGGSTRGYKENQTIYWDRYSRLEKALRDTSKLKDLTQETTIPANVKPNTIFLAAGSATLEPDWSNWQSGISIAKFAVEKLQQLSASETTQQAEVDESGMMPILYGPSGTPTYTIRQDVLKHLFKDEPPDEPPDKIRSLLRPSSVIIRLTLSGTENIILEGHADLEHFTPHRIAPYILDPVQENIHILGLARQCDGPVVRFIPLAAFVNV